MLTFVDCAADHGRLAPQTPPPDADEAADMEQLKEIIRRDPLADISEQDKELLWKMR